MWNKFFVASAILLVGNSSAWSQSGKQPVTVSLEDTSKTSLPAEVESPKLAPKLVLSKWQNSPPRSLASVRGKVVVLQFWSTWCGPCIRSIPFNNQLNQKFKGKDVVFVGVCNTLGAEDMKKKAAEHQIKYPIAVDTDKKTIRAYKVKAYPTYNIIDRSGKLRFIKCPKSKIEDTVAMLLKEKPPAASSTGGSGFSKNPFFDK